MSAGVLASGDHQLTGDFRHREALGVESACLSEHRFAEHRGAPAAVAPVGGGLLPGADPVAVIGTIQVRRGRRPRESVIRLPSHGSRHRRDPFFQRTTRDFAAGVRFEDCPVWCADQVKR